jgi:hypothetical protein
MTSTSTRTALRFAIAAALACLAAVVLAAASQADDKHGGQRLVVRGDATIVDGPPGPDGIPIKIVDGSFRGAPVGKGAYEGDMKLEVAKTFDNGEGGVCAPMRGQIVLGADSPNRLVLGVAGDSCQDGSGPLPLSTFTGLAEFVVKKGTGKYAGYRGAGLATFAEDAADHDRMTLIGRISR